MRCGGSVTAMAIGYTLAAFAAVPGLLGLFHWLSRVPKPPAPGGKAPEGTAAEGVCQVSLADEAERWLQSRT